MYSILIVEDDKNIRNNLKSFLSNEGIAVLTACNGEHGYNQVIKYFPDMIITDIHMPVMDGFDLMKKLKDNPLTSSIPLVILTADVNAFESISKTIDASYICMSKPFVFEDIIEIVNHNKELKHNCSIHK